MHCSGLHKPDDQTVLPPPEAAAFVAPLPVRALPGVGERHNTVNAVLSILFCQCCSGPALVLCLLSLAVGPTFWFTSSHIRSFSAFPGGC